MKERVSTSLREVASGRPCGCWGVHLFADAIDRAGHTVNILSPNFSAGAMRAPLSRSENIPRNLDCERILLYLDSFRYCSVTLNLPVHRTNKFNLACKCCAYYGARWATVCHLAHPSLRATACAVPAILNRLGTFAAGIGRRSAHRLIFS